MLVCTKKRLEQEAIYSLKIVCTQSTEFNLVWYLVFGIFIYLPHNYIT